MYITRQTQLAELWKTQEITPTSPLPEQNQIEGFIDCVAASQLLNLWDYIVVSSLSGHISMSQSHLNVNCGSPRPMELEVSTPKPDTWAEGGGPNNRLLEKPSLKEKEGPNWISNRQHQTRRKLVKQLRVCVASAYMFVLSSSSWIIIC